MVTKLSVGQTWRSRNAMKQCATCLLLSNIISILSWSPVYGGLQPGQQPANYQLCYQRCRAPSASFCLHHAGKLPHACVYFCMCCLYAHSILSFVCNDWHLRSPASTCSTTRMDTSTAQWPSPPPTCPLRTASPCGSLETSSSGSTTPSTTAPTTASALPQLPRCHQCDLSWP